MPRAHVWYRPVVGLSHGSWWISAWFRRWEGEMLRLVVVDTIPLS